MKSFLFGCLVSILLSGCGGSVSISASTGPTSHAVAQANLGNGQPDVAVGDVTGDGKNDIVFGDRDGIKLLVNLGDGQFASAVLICAAKIGVGHPSVAIGDVTGEGLADVIFGDKDGVTILRSLGDGKFEFRK